MNADTVIVNGEEVPLAMGYMPWVMAKANGVDLYEWQKKVLADCVPIGSRVVLRAANGVGKTSGVAAWLVYWHMVVWPRGKIVMTSGSWVQVERQLFPACEKWLRRVEGMEFKKVCVTTNLGGMLVAYSTNDAGKLEGWHEGGEDEPLLIVMDEAKTIPDDMFLAVERCRPTRQLVMSSPGSRKGMFYRLFGDAGEGWVKHVVRADACEHIPKALIETSKEKWGEGHPFFRSAFLGEFMEGDDEQVIIKVEWVEAAEKLEISSHAKATDIVAFCDFAAGGDENVLAVRRGATIEPLICWTDKDTMASVGRFIIEFRRHNLVAEQIWADDAGLGHVMIDALWESGWPINRVNPRNKSYSGQYSDRGAEMWHVAAKDLELGRIKLPQDEILRAQLTGRRILIDSKGRMGVEAKEDMRHRGLNSPDRADAVVGAIANINHVGMLNQTSDFGNLFQNDIEHGSDILRGAWAGM